MHTFSRTRRGVTETWHVKRLWELSAKLPRRRISLLGLHHSNFHGGLFKRLPTFAEMVAYTSDVLAADLRYPIILDPSGNIMDGFHRVAKAHVLGKKTILVKQFDELPPPDKIDRV